MKLKYVTDCLNEARIDIVCKLISDLYTGMLWYSIICASMSFNNYLSKYFIRY
jgi:hypothetical protein